MQPELDWKLISSTGYDPEEKSWYEKAWDTLTDGVETVVDGTTRLVNAVLDTVSSFLGIPLDAIAGLLKLLSGIPIIGNLVNGILFLWRIVLTVVWGVASLVDFFLALLGILPEKRMKLLVIIQRDEAGKGVATVPDEVFPLIQRAIDVYKDQANVRVLPVGYFKYASAFQDTPTASNPYIYRETIPSSSATLDVCCDSCAWGHNFTDAGPEFENK